MSPAQWGAFHRAARGEELEQPLVALIADSPWIPGFLNLSALDYLTVPEVWLEANLRIVRQFPDVTFLPGFWNEFGMAAEPSGFGCRISFSSSQPPTIHPLTLGVEGLAELAPPNPLTDGLMPVILNYYRRLEPGINGAGHHVRIVAARGPLAIAAHLLGVTDFLLGLKLHPAAAEKLLKTTATLTRTWLEAQASALTEVAGILVLDDLVGFLSPKDYLAIAHPRLKEVFEAFPGALKLFHNDTDNPACYPYLRDLGIHLFNGTHLRPLDRVRALVGPEVCLLGNVPPLDVLARGTPQEVKASARECLRQHASPRGLILSAGGGLSPGTPAQNIHALVEAARPV